MSSFENTNSICLIVQAFSLNVACWLTFWITCDKSTDDTFVFKLYRRWIFCSKIFDMKHRYVSEMFAHRKLLTKEQLFFSFCFQIEDYLLSNNHVNNIIVHKFDFSDEEVTAYYISFLKTLSLKLNGQSINFFYNEVNICLKSIDVLRNMNCSFVIISFSAKQWISTLRRSNQILQSFRNDGSNRCSNFNFECLQRFTGEIGHMLNEK